MKVLIHDGSFDGFLTCIYQCYYIYPEVKDIFSKNTYMENLLHEKIYIPTDKIKASKVYNSLKEKTGEESLENIYYAFLSDTLHCYSSLLAYIRLAFKLKTTVNNFLHLNEVKDVLTLKSKVLKESHAFLGLVRFSLINNNFLYSSIEPDHNILELISSHFINRFGEEKFIIHDIKRDLALIYDNSSNNYEIAPLSYDHYETLKDYKEDFISLWKTYYKSTTIKERQNLKLQRKSMPKRYWKHLSETK